MAKKYLDYDGLLYFWQKLKAAFSTKSEGVKTITRSGTTFTVTRADDTTFTFTQQDNTVAKTTTTPTMNGTAAIGSETKYAAGNHVHPTDTTRAPLASPAFTGTPTAPTAATTTNNTQIATTAFVKSVVGSMVSGVSDVEVDGSSVVSDGVAEIPIMTGSTSSAGGRAGLVPARTEPSSPAMTKAYLGADAEWRALDIGFEQPTSGPGNGTLIVELQGTTDAGVRTTLGSEAVPQATTSSAGAMSASDKTKLDSITMTNGVIDSSVLPSFVDDVIEAYARSNQTELSSTWLATGSASGTVITPETGKIYVLMNDSTSYSTNSQFRWGGTAYVKLNDGGVSSITNAEIDTIVAA